MDVKLDAQREDKKWQHWQQVMISACEQSGRSQLVDLLAPQPLDQWLSDCKADCKLVLSPHHADAHNSSAPGSISLLVGPEGGLSEQEVTASLDKGFAPLRLGPRILRTETAPLAAISILQSRWGDMS